MNTENKLHHESIIVGMIIGAFIALLVTHVLIKFALPKSPHKSDTATELPEEYKQITEKDTLKGYLSSSLRAFCKLYCNPKRLLNTFVI